MRFQVSADVVRVSQERMLEGRLRLFQIAEAAERKPRAPNEMLQRVTDSRLAEADLKSSAWSVPMDPADQPYMGVTGMYSSMSKSVGVLVSHCYQTLCGSDA